MTQPNNSSAFLGRLSTPLLPLSAVERRESDDWQRHYPTEFLLPQIRKHIELTEFPFVSENLMNHEWDRERLIAEVNRLGHWEYYFPFAHGVTTRINSSFDDDTVRFHRYRSALISETIADILGEEKKGATAIDLACHCGAFTMDLANRGLEHVFGLEYRDKNLAQARFLKEYYQVRNASFGQGDVYELDASKTYDVVMCLGILYHVVQPVELLEFCFRSARKFAVIDTVCHKQPISAYMVVGDKNPEIAIEGTRRVEFQPTYRGLLETLKQVGFNDIVEVVGTCAERITLYTDQTRRCLIAFK